MNYNKWGRAVNVYDPKILVILLIKGIEMKRKLAVLNELIKSMEFRREWFNLPLPLGYTTTGRLHDMSVGGTGARTRIDELRKAGIDIHHRAFRYVDNETGLLNDPDVLGVTDEEIIESRFTRLVDPEGHVMECHAYCLVTPISYIDVENGKLKPQGTKLFEQSTMEF